MTRSKDSNHYILLAVVTLAGFALRQAYLLDHDAWWDEICTATRALLPLSDLWTSLKYQGPSPVSTDSSPPLSHTLIHFSLYLGQSGYFLKLPNSIFGTLTIPAVYLLGKRLVNSRVGLLAALFIALSAFHVSYSRDARWYSLFYLASIFSFYFFLSALKRNKLWQWIGLAVSSVVMLYTSYMAIIFLFSLVCSFVLWMFTTSRGDDIYRKKIILRFVFCVLFVLLAYSPWMSGQINAYYFLYSDGARPQFSLLGLLSLLKSTVMPNYYVGFDSKLIIGSILVSGAVLFVVAKKYFELGTLCLWAVLPLVAAYNVKTVNTISPKYILFMLFVVAFFLAVVSDGIGGLVTLRVQRYKENLQLALGIVLVFSMSYFSIQFYPGHLVEGINSDKSAISWLSREKFNSEYILFERSRQHKAIMDWYIPGSYRQLDETSDLAYKRYLLVSGWAPSLPKNEDMTVVGDFAFSRGGIINRSPVVVDPDASGTYMYVDNFHDFQAYADASHLSNICVSTSRKVLELYDLNKSGEVTYTFINPSESLISNMLVQLRVVLERGDYIVPDCTLLVSATNHLGEKRTLRSIDASAFPPLGGAIDISNALDTNFLANGPVKLSLEFSRGIKAGILGVENLAVTFQLGAAPKTEVDSVAIYARNIAGHTRMTTWDKAVWPVNPPGPYAFSIRHPAGIQELKEFKDRYPKAQPVYTLKNRLGEDQTLYFDPWGEDPFLRLRSGQGKILVTSDTSMQKDYVLRGSMDFPVVHSGDQAWPLTLKTPPGSVTTIVPGGQGRIDLRPLFTERDFSPLQMERYNGIKKLRGEDCITCSSKNNCQLVYGIQSIYPIQEIRVVWYPRLHSDVSRKNSVALSVALDGMPAKTIDSYKSRGTDTWDGPERRVTTLKLEKPATRLEVVFDLQNDATQIWSVSNMAMTMEAKLDTRSAPGITLGDGSEAWIEGGRMNDFGVFFPKDRAIFRDNLEYMH